jgi:UDP-N-acetylmuramate--alanine ligase
MSGIAAMYAALGVPVTGSDRDDSQILQTLRAQGIDARVGHDAANLGEAQTVVYSTAIPDTNPELAAARARGLRVWHRSAALAALMLGHTAVCVSGTHGKTTTSAMAAHLLRAAGRDPSWVLGARLADGRSSHLGGGPEFVIEADESDGSFLQYPVDIAIITNIEDDHLDNWHTPENYHGGFLRFASRARTVVASADDPGARELTARLSGPRLVTFGLRESADVRVQDAELLPGGARATLSGLGDSGPFELPVPGAHNLANFAAAYTAARLLGVDGGLLRAAAGSFSGAERRFEFLGEAGGIRVVDDYAHHQTELAATLKAARRFAGEGRVVACFQPHLFTRTREYAAQLGEALTLADEIVVTDIYPAREEPIPGVTGELVAQAVRRLGRECEYVPQMADLPRELARIAKPGDLVVTLGAGSITSVGREFLALKRGS